MIQAQRIVFAGSPEFAVTQLDAMLAARLPVCGVLSQPDRPAGRKRKLQPTPVKTRALDLGIPVATPATLRGGDGNGSGTGAGELAHTLRRRWATCRTEHWPLQLLPLRPLCSQHRPLGYRSLWRRPPVSATRSWTASGCTHTTSTR